MSFFRIPERHRRCLLPATALVLATYLVLVFQPLGRRSAELDRPLATARADLAFALNQSELEILDSAAIESRLRGTLRSLAGLQETATDLTKRIALRDEIRGRMQAPFQLFDYQYERQVETEHLTRLADQHQVKLAPAVLAALPQHVAEMRNPGLLWAELEFTHHLLVTAIRNKVSAIHTLHAPSPHTDLVETNSTRILTAVPLKIELTGTMGDVTRFLRALPLRTDELRAAGLPAGTEAKPPLFVDHLLVLKQSPSKLDEVHLVLDVSGFVPRELGRTSPAL